MFGKDEIPLPILNPPRYTRISTCRLLSVYLMTANGHTIVQCDSVGNAPWDRNDGGVLAGPPPETLASR